MQNCLTLYCKTLLILEIPVSSALRNFLHIQVSVLKALPSVLFFVTRLECFKARLACRYSSP